MKKYDAAAIEADWKIALVVYSALWGVVATSMTVKGYGVVAVGMTLIVYIGLLFAFVWCEHQACAEE